MSVEFQLRLNYQNFFDDKPLVFEEYIKGIDKDFLWKAVAYFANRNNSTKKHYNAKQTIEDWFKCYPDIEIELLSKLKTDGHIFDVISSLQFTEYIMQNDFPETPSISDKTIAINVFKAYLLLNSNQDKKEKIGFGKLEKDTTIADKFIANIILMSFYNSDLQNYYINDLYFCQLYKACSYFQYLEQELPQHLELFLKKYSCSTWKEWIIKMSSAILPIIKNSDDTYSELISENGNSFLKALSIENNEKYTQKDFITLRSKPLLEVGDNVFRIINTLFLVEKLFKSIQFQISLEINKQVDEKNKIDVKSTVGDNFSERTLLYEFIKKSFPRRKWIHISGSDFVEKKYNGEPDYYLRFKNKIFLFESKDVILKGEIKQSRDFAQIENALKEKFYIEGKSNTAVNQLTKNIKRIFDKDYNKCDKDYDTDKITIYPILVTHDRQFDTPGINKLINNWFYNELTKLKEKYDISKINPIVVTNIDTFILYHEIFKQRGIYRIEKLIDDYFDAKTYEPFSNFVDKIMDSKTNKKHPTFITESINDLFEKR